MLGLSVRSFLLLGSLFTFVGVANAQPVFAEKSRDLGGAPRGAVLQHSVKITNKYDRELHVSGIRTSCGVCSSASMSQSSIAPGESAQLNINIDTSKYAGHRQFYVYVTFDRPFFEEQFVSVTAVSRDDLSIAPTTLNFGTVKAGAGPMVQTQIDYRGGLANWAITGISNDNGYIQPKIEEIGRQPGTVSYRLTVKLRDDLPPGSWHADLWLNTTDLSSPKIKVPLSVEVQSTLTAAPQSFDLGKLAKGGQLEKKVVLRGAQPFKITKIEGLDANIEVSGQSDTPKEVQVLRLKYSAGAKPGDFERKLKIFTDLPKDNAVAVILRGNQSP